MKNTIRHHRYLNGEMTQQELARRAGVAYRFNDQHQALSQFWLAYFLGKSNRKFAPIGLEFQYNKNL